MDLNITLTPSFLNSDGEDQLLLRAIKTKFDEKRATETAASSPPKFNIPLLKIAGGTSSESNQAVQTSNSATELNQFLIKQLQKKHTQNDLSKKNTGFVLPKLNSTSDKTAVKFELPILKTCNENSKVSSLTTAIGALKVQENVDKEKVKSTPTTIDLTTALSTNLKTHQGTPPTRDLIKPQQYDGELEFEIPFIDCDRVNGTKKYKILLPASNEYCVTDVSKFLLQHTLAEPSAVGRLLSTDGIKYLEPLPLKYFTPQFRQQQKVKHSIEPFQFDTQSPDDIVLLALSKYQRRHYN